MEALPIIAIPAQSHQETGPQRFAVPQDPITQDRAASLAASRAGSEGFNEPDVEVAPVIPRVKPPTVNPVAVTPKAPDMSAGSYAGHLGTVTAAVEQKEPAPPSLDTLHVSALAAELAKRRAASNDGKLEVNKALREAGFTLAGQSPKSKR